VTMVCKYYLEIYRHTLYPQEGPGWVDINSLGLHPELVQRLGELGVVEIRNGCVRADEISKLHKIIRLRRSLGVNLPGACIIVDLLDRIEELEQEIERLRRRR